jgi:hypothetical protein
LVDFSYRDEFAAKPLPLCMDFCILQQAKFSAGFSVYRNLFRGNGEKCAFLAVSKVVMSKLRFDTDPVVIRTLMVLNISIQ